MWTAKEEIAFGEVPIKGVVIAGTKSGCGKTTVSLGLMAALTKRGWQVAPFKVGPDFIDPGHHARITGRPSRNLDGWMLSQRYNCQRFESTALRADIGVVEGVMGLFDGYDGRSEAGSTAQMAKWLGLPVVLLVDAKSMARSAAAVVQGFERFDPKIRFAGVVFNNIGSQRHLTYLREALENHVAMPCLGGTAHRPDVVIPERYLGLLTSEDHPLNGQRIDLLAQTIEECLDVEGLVRRLPQINAARPTPRLSGSQRPAASVRIGIARDQAFCFYYQDNFDLLESCGANLVFFSPIHDAQLPADLDGIYLGGGYPELHAAKLAGNERLRGEIRRRSKQGMPIYGECGGFMYLCRELIDTRGEPHPMVGCFPFKTRMAPRLRSLGYREITLLRDTPIGKKGWGIRGHEFHYSELDRNTAEHHVAEVYQISGRANQKALFEGYQKDRTLGSYVHLHFGSRPDAPARFVSTCLQYKNQRTEAA